LAPGLGEPPGRPRDGPRLALTAVLHLCYTWWRRDNMAAKNPRVMTVLERPLYQRIKRAARSQGLTLSAKVRDLLREAMQQEDEDAYWVREGEKRLATWDDSKALTEEEAWK